MSEPEIPIKDEVQKEEETKFEKISIMVLFLAIIALLGFLISVIFFG
jgi:hypothetical protein